MFDNKTTKANWAPALRHLRKVDPILRDLIERVGPCTLEPRRDYFVALTKSIFSQQISTAIANTLFQRYRALHPRGVPTPQSTIELLTCGNEERLRLTGLSKQKRTYVLDLARHFHEGKIPTRRFGKMTDEEITQSLIPVKGVGRWTTEMFLIFVLNRPDVFPLDDFGVQTAMKRFYGLPDRPKRPQMIPVAEPWRPWRSVATWYLWRGLALPAAPAADT